MTVTQHTAISPPSHLGEPSSRALTNVDLDHVSGGTTAPRDAAPRDAATGHATGRRVELPIFITTPVGAAS
jgi:hypothetical protein